MDFVNFKELRAAGNLLLQELADEDYMAANWRVTRATQQVNHHLLALVSGPRTRFF